ncbi:hypothetical protein [Telmatospirillum sp. J64-1]|uniref:hypothetical protein n=1 Tax=Telmatospirillum sp. J64-1 TaxID=2502183 RepID=UPI00115D7BE3|nr:hypothetical protein [Telmatospirillum sp. J64-1]
MLPFLKKDAFPALGQTGASSLKGSDPKWRKSPKKVFYRLIGVNPKEHGLGGLGGVYVIWHRGVRPRWIHVGASEDLAATLNDLLDDKEIQALEIHGGVYFTWSPIAPEFRDGTVLYLTDILRPLMPEPRPGEEIDPSADPVPVLPPS